MNSTKMTEFHYLIIGASQAGLTAAKEIRQRDQNGSIGILVDEPYLPYKRTKLSKNLIKKISGDDFALFEQAWYGEQKLELMKNSQVVKIDPDHKKVFLKRGESMGYTKLLIASGASSRRLEIPGGEFIQYLWYRKEAEEIQKSMEQSKRVIVIGAGVEGIELADQFYQAGKKVTLIGQSSEPMERWLDAPLRQGLVEEMTKAGIEQHLGNTVTKIEKVENGFIIYTEKGSFPADMVVASTGIQQRLDFLQDLSVCGSRGLLVNEYLQTDLTDVYGAGDILQLSEDYSQGLWHSAEYQAKIAAANMTGDSQKIQKISFRLKTEVFGSFYFSQAYNRGDCGEERMILQEKNRSLKVFLKEGIVVAALMKNYNEIAKPLQKMVQSGLTEKEFREKLTEWGFPA